MQDNSWRTYAAVLRKRLWMILLLFTVTMIVILAGALTAKPKYGATVRLQVIPMESEQVALYSPVYTGNADAIDLTAYQFLQTVKSSAVAWTTIGRLALNSNATRLLDQIRTTQDGEFVSVTAEAEAPQEAVEIVTAQVQNALETFRANRSRPAVVTGEFITAQLASAENELAGARTELLRFRLTENVDSLEREMEATQDYVRQLRTRREDAILAQASLKARIAAVEAEVAELEASSVSPVDAEVENAEANARPERLIIQQDYISSLRADLAAEMALQTEFDRSIANWTTELTSLIGLSEEYTRLIETVSRAQNTRDFLFNKGLEARLKQEQGTSVGYLKVVQPASQPDRSLPNRAVQLALVGGLLSLIAGVVLAFLFEFVETLFRGGQPAQ